jgi:hypothetical protein
MHDPTPAEWVVGLLVIIGGGASENRADAPDPLRPRSWFEVRIPTRTDRDDRFSSHCSVNTFGAGCSAQGSMLP